MTAPAQAQTTEADKEVQEKYVSRLRARLARPKITIEDARDGMLDCFVSTYHTGVKQGLKGIIGVDASPDQVAQVTARMFRDRLEKRGISFDSPTADGLNAVKEELDEEFHFSELPAEMSATHDQVCSLLLAKADGLIDHDGDKSVVSNRSNASTVREIHKPPAIRPPMPRVDRSATRAVPTVPPPAASIAPRPAANPVTDNLRRALVSYLDETCKLAATASPTELLQRLDRARSLAQSVAEFS